MRERGKVGSYGGVKVLSKLWSGVLPAGAKGESDVTHGDMGVKQWPLSCELVALPMLVSQDYFKNALVIMIVCQRMGYEQSPVVSSAGF